MGDHESMGEEKCCGRHETHNEVNMFPITNELWMRLPSTLPCITNKVTYTWMWTLRAHLNMPIRRQLCGLRMRHLHERAFRIIGVREPSLLYRIELCMILRYVWSISNLIPSFVYYLDRFFLDNTMISESGTCVQELKRLEARSIELELLEFTMGSARMLFQNIAWLVSSV